MFLLLLLIQTALAEYVFTVFQALSQEQLQHIQALPTVTSTVIFQNLNVLKTTENFQPLLDYLTAEGITAFDIDEERILATDADWLPDRLDQISLPLDGNFFPRGTGSNVDIYIVDTGVRTNHNEFEGRATLAYAVTGSTAPYCGIHGTAVASVAAGKTVGVARQARIKSVKITPQSGGSCTITLFNLLEALAWMVENVVGPAVVNFSLSGSGSSSVDSLINQLIAKNIVVVAAAGNSGIQNGACTISPARNPNVLSIAGSTITDTRWSSTNYGNCINYFAPGQSVRTADAGGTNSYFNSISGTSFSSPAAAGSAAIYIREIIGDGGSATVTAVKNKFQGLSVVGAISNPSGTPNRLVYVGEGETDSPVSSSNKILQSFVTILLFL